VNPDVVMKTPLFARCPARAPQPPEAAREALRIARALEPVVRPAGAILEDLLGAARQELRAIFFRQLQRIGSREVCVARQGAFWLTG
jgi:hypothetical protein